jgi:hypothetical protein
MLLWTRRYILSSRWQLWMVRYCKAGEISLAFGSSPLFPRSGAIESGANICFIGNARPIFWRLSRSRVPRFSKVSLRISNAHWIIGIHPVELFHRWYKGHRWESICLANGSQSRLGHQLNENGFQWEDYKWDHSLIQEKCTRLWFKKEIYHPRS